MKHPSKIVIDTSVFINPAAFKLLAKTPLEAFVNFIEKAKEKDISLYMPPSILEELLKLLGETKDIPINLLSYIRRKPPKKYEIFVPSLFLYEFIEESRSRINKGLRIAEKYTRYALERKKTEEEMIKTLREEFRVALREGIIDSRQDIDLLILAKEIESPVLSSDQGLIKWAEKLGIEALDLKEIKHLLFGSEPK